MPSAFPIARLAEVLDAGWGLTGLANAEALKDDRVWRVRLDDGRAFVLKNWGALDAGFEERVAFHQDVLRHARERGVVVEQAVPTRAGGVIHRHDTDAWWLTLPLANAPRELSPTEFDELQRGYGRAIAQLHRALASYPEAEARRRAWRKDLYAEVTAQGLPAIRTGLRSPARERFAALVEPMIGELERLRGLPEQLIFFDMHHGNVLRDGARVSGFVDGNHLSIGLRIWDLLALMSQALGGLSTADVPAWVRYDLLLLDAYEDVNPLSAAERDAIWSGLLGLKLDQLAWWLGRGQSVGPLLGQFERLAEARPLFS